MGYQFSDDQRMQFAAFLAHQRTCIISTIAAQGTWAMPVRYHPRSRSVGSGASTLEVECLIPRWADIAHYLAKTSDVLLIVQASSGAGLRWLQIKGRAKPVEAPDWIHLLPRWVSKVQPDALYQVVHVNPSRIDLFDEDLGWGLHETLEW